jgi:putative polyhydroxyalkanoate system protein
MGRRGAPFSWLESPHSMSEISIRRGHTLNPAQARRAAEEMARELQEAFELEFEWHGNALHFHRSGVEGHLVLEHKAVSIEVRLGFLLAMVKPKIEEHIHENLDRIFSSAKKSVAKKPAARKPAAKKR